MIGQPVYDRHFGVGCQFGQFLVFGRPHHDRIDIAIDARGTAMVSPRPICISLGVRTTTVPPSCFIAISTTRASGSTASQNIASARPSGPRGTVQFFAPLERRPHIDDAAQFADATSLSSRKCRGALFMTQTLAHRYR